MLSAERLRLPVTRPSTAWPVLEVAHVPPLMPAAAGGLSGRPRCRIYPVGRQWILQMESASAWLFGDGLFEPPPRLKFPSLEAAVAHAERHGYDYRIITPSPVTRIAERCRPTTRRDGPQRERTATEH